MKRRALVTATLTPVGVLGVAGVAFAFWTVASSGAAGSAAADALGIPTVSTSGVTTSNVTINVTAAPTSGPAPTAYRVDRTGPGSAVPSVCSITGSTGSCADPAPVQGAVNNYSVYGLIGSSWVASTPGTTTASVPGGDIVAPVTTASMSQAPNTAGWNKADVTVTLSATDGGTGVKQITYSSTGSQVTGSTTVSGATASLIINTAGSTTINYFATDNANNVESAKALLVKLDKTAPANSFALTSVTGGASLGGAKIYYRGAASGQFSIANSVSDAGSGPASSTTLGFLGDATGWSHTPSTVSTLTSGAFVSNPYGWVGSTTSAPQAGIYGSDVADNQSPTTLQLENDSTAPSGGSISVTPSGATKNASGSVTFNAGTDSQAGLNTATAVLQRASAVDNHDGTCGGFLTFSTIATAPVSPYTDGSRNEGCYAYKYVVSDKLGNSTTYGPTSATTVDTTAPATSSINVAGASPTNATTLPFTVTFSEPVNTAAVVAARFVATTSGVSGTAPTIGTITPTSPSGGFATAYTVNVNTTGATGTNSGTVRLDLTTVGSIQDAATNAMTATRNGDQSYTFDTTRPTVSSINVAGASPTNATTLPFTVTFSEPVNTAAVVAARFVATTSGVSGTAPTIGTITPTSPSGGFATAYTVNVNTTGATGTNSGTVRLDLTTVGSIQDAATNAMTATRNGDQSYTFDTTRPTVSSINVTDASPTNATTLPFTVTFSEPVNTAAVVAARFVATTSGVSGTAPTIGTITPTSPSGGFATAYTVNVNTTGATGTNSGTVRLDLTTVGSIQDAATNAMTATRNGDQSYTFDTTAPTNVKFTSIADGGGSSKVDFAGTNGTDANDGQVDLLVCKSNAFPCAAGNSFASGSDTTVSSGNWAVSFNNPGTATGLYAQLTQADTAGNSTVTVVGPFNNSPTSPTVTAVSPASGKAAGGEVLTLTGTAFGTTTGVTVGGTAATGVTINSATSLTITSPAHSAGQVDVVVTNLTGTSSVVAADKFTYDTTPTVTAVSPVAGKAVGGNVVTVTGTGFLTATGVTFGGTAGTSLSITSDTSLSITSPAKTAGQYDVLVTNTTGTSSAVAADKFTYDTTPTVTAVSPVAGKAVGGNVVTVTGTGFLTATGVTFGGTAGTSLSITSDTSLSITSPAKTAGQYDVLVTNTTGTSSAVAADKFTYDTTPTVTAVSPNTGGIAGGTVVTVTGTGFLTATGVTFGGTAGTSLSITSDTSLSITSPARSAGAVDVRVTNTTGQSPVNSPADRFTYS